MTRSNITWQHHNITQQDRGNHKKQHSCIIWLTGLSGSGKSTIANAVEYKLFLQGYHTYLLDGDNVRHGLNKDLAFSVEDRVENIRRIGELSKLMIDAGLLVMTAFISPYQSDRQIVKNLVQNNEFIEVYIKTSLEECERRDPKGLYKKARKGEIKNFTGIDSEYQIPDNPNIIIDTVKFDVEACANQIITYLNNHGILKR